MSSIEIWITITGFIYVILASQNRSSCWFFGIISSGLLAYQSAVHYKFYSDSALNIFYVVMGFYGLWCWWKADQKSTEETQISTLNPSTMLWVIALGLGLTLTTGFLLEEYSDAFATYWDAGTTVFGVIATVLLIKRYVENWYLWIIVDIIMVVLYMSRGGQAPALLFGLYTLIAIYGAFSWNKLLKIRA